MKHDMKHDLSPDLSTVLQPIATAKGLPNRHYIDPETFQTETRALLGDNWAGIGFAASIPNDGDVKPVDFLGIPMLMVRDNGAVRVYQNTCRHRGMILVDAPANIRGTIRCPYHSWCYGLDGALRSTPHVGGAGCNVHDGIKRADLGLFEIRSHVYMDVVFVNVSGKAAEFEEAHADLLARWADFNQPLYAGGADSMFQLNVACNWKLAVENYCESYHLPWVHPDLNLVSKLEDHYHIEKRWQYSGQGSYKYTQMTGDAGEVFADFGGLADKWDAGAEYVALYPNVLFGVHRDHTFAIILQPIDCGNTVEHVALYYASAECAGARFADLRVKNAGFWKGVFKEDIFVVEGMQRGRSGPMFDGGKFSPVMDGPTHLFHEWVADKMTSYQGADGG